MDNASLLVGRNRPDDFGLVTKEFASSSDGIFSTSTPRNKRSVSYLDVSYSYEEDRVPFSATSLEKIRGISQSINDLNLLRERQMGRRHETSILFGDNFLEEHARKLHEARMRIKALEAKYCDPKRLRSHSNLARDKDLGSQEKIAAPKGNASGCASAISKENETTALTGSKENPVDKPEDIELPIENGSSSFEEFHAEQHGEDDLDSGISADRAPVLNVTNPTRAETGKRPVTWACDMFNVSALSQGRGWHESTRLYPNEIGGSHSHGYKGFLGSMEFGRHACSTNPDHSEKTKWQSMPNLGSNNNGFPEEKKMMYGEAIPVDPNDKKQHRNKHGRKSGMYVVNMSPVNEHQQHNKKHKFRIKLFHKKNPQKNALKIAAVGAPKEAQPIGRIMGLHSTTENAYTIELSRPENGSYGFRLQNGYHHHKNGIFVSKIADKKAKKFLGGFIHVGDEVLEINNTSVQDQSCKTVNKLVKNSGKLLLTILPYSSRRD